MSELIIAGEIQYRAQVLRQYQWLIARKAELEEEARLAKKEKERRERERRIRAEKKRVGRLLNEASLPRQASEIRGYVEAVLAANAAAREPLPQEMMVTWIAWTRSEADQIDPIRSGRFRDAIKRGADGTSE